MKGMGIKAQLLPPTQGYGAAGLEVKIIEPGSSHTKPTNQNKTKVREKDTVDSSYLTD